MANEIVQSENVGQLVDVSEFGLPATYDDKLFTEMSKSSFLPRLQLCGSNSTLVKEEKIAIAHYAIVAGKNDFRDLGKSVDLIPLSIRFVAVRMADGQVATFYDPQSDDFKQVQEESSQQDSMCMYGPQFLVWIPQAGEFASFLFGSKSTRQEARKMRPFLGRACTLKSKLVNYQKYSWHVPVVLECNSSLSIPDSDIMEKTVHTFNNPKQSSVEFDDESNSTEDVRER